MSILRIEAVKVLTGHRSNTSIYEAIRVGLFPSNISIGRRARGWPSAEVLAVNAARIGGFSDLRIREIVEKIHERRIAVADALRADATGATSETMSVPGKEAPC